MQADGVRCRRGDVGKCRGRSKASKQDRLGGFKKRREAHDSHILTASTWPVEHLAVRVAPLTGLFPLSPPETVVSSHRSCVWPEVAGDAHGRILAFYCDAPPSRYVRTWQRIDADLVDVIATRCNALEQSFQAVGEEGRSYWGPTAELLTRRIREMAGSDAIRVATSGPVRAGCSSAMTDLQSLRTLIHRSSGSASKRIDKNATRVSKLATFQNRAFFKTGGLPLGRRRDGPIGLWVKPIRGACDLSGCTVLNGPLRFVLFLKGF